MKKSGIAVAIIGAILIVAGIISRIRRLQAVSVIGGADGPTAIFVAGKFSNLWLIGVIAGVILLGVGLLVLIKRK